MLSRDAPSGGGVPRSASSYTVAAPDMEDVKESVRQVGSVLIPGNLGLTKYSDIRLLQAMETRAGVV